MLLTRYWWLIALRGISSIFFSLYFFFYPELTLELLAKGFCLYAFADGTICILVALLTAESRAWRAVFLAIGLLGIASGFLTLYQPIITAVILFLSIGPWVIFTGTLEIAAGYIFRERLQGTGWLKLAGTVSLAAGVILLFQQFSGFLPIAILIGAYQVIRGIINLMISFGIRRNQTELEAEFNDGK